MRRRRVGGGERRVGVVRAPARRNFSDRLFHTRRGRRDFRGRGPGRVQVAHRRRPGMRRAGLVARARGPEVMVRGGGSLCRHPSSLGARSRARAQQPPTQSDAGWARDLGSVSTSRGRASGCARERAAGQGARSRRGGGERTWCVRACVCVGVVQSTTPVTKGQEEGEVNYCIGNENERAGLCEERWLPPRRRLFALPRCRRRRHTPSERAKAPALDSSPPAL